MPLEGKIEIDLVDKRDKAAWLFGSQKARPETANAGAGMMNIVNPEKPAANTIMNIVNPERTTTNTIMNAGRPERPGTVMNAGRPERTTGSDSIMDMVAKPSAAAGEAGAAGGLLGGMLTPMLAALAPLAIIAGGIAMIVKSSGLLQSMIGGITKVLMLILRPIGDILGVALMPLLYIMRPIGMFFNILMRPYLQKAMAAMRAGGALLQAGKPAEAMTAFMTGAEYLLKPILDLNVKVITEAFGGMADILGTMFRDVPFLGQAFMNLGVAIRAGGQSFIDVTTNMLDIQLGNVLAMAESKTGIVMSGIVKSLNDAEVSGAYSMAMMKTGICNPLTELSTWVSGTWAPDFAGAVKKAMMEALGYQGTSTQSGVTWSKPNVSPAAAAAVQAYSSPPKSVTYNTGGSVYDKLNSLGMCGLNP
jgi:hypothetical protein